MFNIHKYIPIWIYNKPYIHIYVHQYYIFMFQHWILYIAPWPFLSLYDFCVFYFREIIFVFAKNVPIGQVLCFVFLYWQQILCPCMDLIVLLTEDRYWSVHWKIVQWNQPFYILHLHDLGNFIQYKLNYINTHVEFGQEL